MAIWVLVSLVLGGLIGYGVFYFKYENASLIDELRENFAKTKQENEQQQHQLRELAEQNKLLKAKAQQLLDQNQDYVKIVSELSRYYYLLQQSHEKIQDLQLLLSSFDTDVAKKIEKVTSTPVYTPDLWTSAEKKFF